MTNLRREIIAIFEAGLEAVKPDSAIKSACRVENDTLFIRKKPYLLDNYENIFVIGTGKGTAPMAKAMEEILGDQLSDGLIVVKYGHTEPLEKIKTLEAGHPIPDQAGVEGAKAILELAVRANKSDLVICLISGGGSALIPCPPPGISLKDKQDTTKLLLQCGARIDEINCIRKHLSLIKGGLLAKAVFPATLVTLMVSDVIGDDMGVIASGPTVPDDSTFAMCVQIMDKYQIAQAIPGSVSEYLQRGLAGMILETPDESQRYFLETHQQIIASNRDAIAAVQEEAVFRGYNTHVYSTTLEGESREVAKALISMAKKSASLGSPAKTPACIIAGGETTVTINGDGLGGRNQEMALSAAIEIQDCGNISFLSCGTDGNDGPTDSTGAVVDAETIERANELKIDPLSYLNNNDAYHFFEKTGGHVKTGPTNTNVMDLQIMLILPNY